MTTVEKDIKETNDKIAEVREIVTKRAKAVKEIGYKEEELKLFVEKYINENVMNNNDRFSRGN